jgi:hypothetical protein
LDDSAATVASMHASTNEPMKSRRRRPSLSVSAAPYVKKYYISTWTKFTAGWIEF